ncbi:MAG: biotin transporter BioY [Candidatus Heimdallarchaeaceae archaeon]
MIIASLNQLERVKQTYFNWRINASISKKILLSFSMSCLTGLLAQIRIYLPWTPVPITGQTYAVFLSAFLLGNIWGGISQVIYVTLGVLGIPWFAGWKGGIEIILGPTVGYLVGFVVASFLLGYVADKKEKARKVVSLIVIITLTNFVIIYGLGLLWLGLWLYELQKTVPTLIELLMMGVIPFIGGDLVKILVAVGTGKIILPKAKREKNEKGKPMR